MNIGKIWKNSCYGLYKVKLKEKQVLEFLTL